ncbi:WGR domain-containing protein [Escherichia sp. E3356]|uniref:WGR domain-containing protein n=1 Tax=Escherichia sp. E3356 TaxID=2044461 RepID=UPI003211F8A6
MRHFIYQDEKSHKFWAVEQQGNELHISWGKVGTNGQSQVKSFADAAAAAKAEQKLIAEKNEKRLCGRRFGKRIYPSSHQSHS